MHIEAFAEQAVVPPLPVGSVADEWVEDMVEVFSDLPRTACQRSDFHQ